MGTRLRADVAAANALTGRWCAAGGSADFVVSGAGLWPLLALLAAAAEGPARAELSAAAGLAAAESHSAGVDLLRELDGAESVSAALGVWFREEIHPRAEWVGSLPRGTVDRLTDQGALDRWAAERTGGRIERFPLRIAGDTVMMLATALLARTTWRTSFDDTWRRVERGPWHGYGGPFLSRVAADVDSVTLLAAPSPVTRAIVAGDNDLDVHLLLGDGTPAAVVGTGLAALDGQVPVWADPPVGAVAPGLAVAEIPSVAPGDVVRITLPPFDIRSSHDLLTEAHLYGLVACTDSARGHFPGIAAEPLCVSSAVQDVRASFTSGGFEAAAVTAMGMRVGSAAPPPARRRIRCVSLTLDRPFGFLAIHRPTGLAVVAGWVAAPPTP